MGGELPTGYDIVQFGCGRRSCCWLWRDIMIRHTYRFLGLALGVSLAFSANALPTLSFVERTGVVGPNDVVDIRLRLTADSGG